MKLKFLLLISVILLLVLASCSGKKHDHKAGELIVENLVLPDCFNDGSQDNVIYCVSCTEEIWRDTVTIKSKGHVPMDPVAEESVPADCLNDGHYESVTYCAVCDAELERQTVIAESLGHAPAEPILENHIPAGCLTEGSQEKVTYCSRCNTELERKVEVLSSLGHTPADATFTNVIEPVCKTDGSRVSILDCVRCGTELSKTVEVIPAKGHDWQGGDKCKHCGIAYSVEESLEFKLSDDGTYYSITGIGTFYSTILHMPSEYNGLPVREISDFAFQDCTFIIEAYIPASITRLGYGAAMGCTSLEKLVLEDRNGWSLYDGQEDPKIFPIPGFMLINTSTYFDLLLEDDQFALVKTEEWK